MFLFGGISCRNCSPTDIRIRHVRKTRCAYPVAIRSWLLCWVCTSLNLTCDKWLTFLKPPLMGAPLWAVWSKAYFFARFCCLHGVIPSLSCLLKHIDMAAGFSSWCSFGPKHCIYARLSFPGWRVRSRSPNEFWVRALYYFLMPCLMSLCYLVPSYLISGMRGPEGKLWLFSPLRRLQGRPWALLFQDL